MTVSPVGVRHDLAVELARMPEVVAALLAEHVSDRYGRCVVCRQQQRAHAQVWPCALAGLARAAQCLLEQQRSIVCARCRRRSWHPVDVAQGYCAACHDWTT